MWTPHNKSGYRARRNSISAGCSRQRFVDLMSVEGSHVEKGGEGFGLHFEVDFSIDVGSVERDVSEPASDGVDIDAGTRRCVAVV